MAGGQSNLGLLGTLVVSAGAVRPYVLVSGLVGPLPSRRCWLLGRSSLCLPPALTSFTGAFVIPALNNVFQSNYPTARRGKPFGYSTSATTGTLAPACHAAGHLLTWREQLFRFLFGGAGVLGFFSCWFLSRIAPPVSQQRRTSKPAVTSLSDAISTLRRDRAYPVFQRNFFLYGMSFIMLLPIVPILLVEDLRLSYATISVAQGVAAQLPTALFAPMAGRLHDRLNPATYSAWCFLTVATVPLLLLLLAPRVPPHARSWVMVAFTVQNTAMAGLFVVWTIGSLYFAGPAVAAPYQSIHVSLTGIRGLIAPGVALLIYRVGGTGAVLVCASIHCFGAAILMVRLGRAARRSERRAGSSSL